jgi:hypothetical protein
MCTSETISIICKNQCEGQVTFGKCECVDGISNVVCNGEGACTDSTVQQICLSKCGTKINIKTCECKDSVATTKCHDEETIAVVSRAHSLVLVARLAITVVVSSALLTSL